MFTSVLDRAINTANIIKKKLNEINGLVKNTYLKQN